MLTEAVEVREFHKYGFACHGIFAKVDIPANTLIWENDAPTRYFTKKEVSEHPEKEVLIKFAHMTGDDCFDSTVDPYEDPSWFLNHSCDPTVWFATDDKIFTRRDVKKDEQLCYDYTATETESSLSYGMICKCGAKNCRGKLTFSEWRSREFIRNNLGHLPPFILQKHLENGWYDPRVELLYKPNGSFGLFCRKESESHLKAGQTVLIFSGKILHRNEMIKPGALTQKELNMSRQISREMWQVPALSVDGSPVWETSSHLNHSCDPNCGMKDSVTVVAMRDIAPGEELAIDYAMVNDGSCIDESNNFSCECKSIVCRRQITSCDWKLSKLQAKYDHFFSPFVKELISTLPNLDDSINNNLINS